jgi:hypothetical protein
MSVQTGDIIGALEDLEVARFKTNNKGEVLGFAGLGEKLQPSIVVSTQAPTDHDGRPDGTVWIQVAP